MLVKYKGMYHPTNISVMFTNVAVTKVIGDCIALLACSLYSITSFSWVWHMSLCKQPNTHIYIYIHTSTPPTPQGLKTVSTTSGESGPIEIN